MTPRCGATTAAEVRCKRPGRFDGYCGTHRRCDQCGEPRWWECSPAAFCRLHAGAHAADCGFCGSHYWRTVGPWQWPLRDRPPALPDAPGQFGAERKHDIHTGVDLYCPVGTIALAVEDGVAVTVEDFTGPDAGSPWWLPTKAVLVEGASGVVVYGEVSPCLAEGSRVLEGSPVGAVMQVLRTDKGRPMAMLHLELMAPGSRTTLWWRLKQNRPAALRDPTAALQAALDK